MSFSWECYLNAVKWGKARQDELSDLRERLKVIKKERDTLKLDKKRFRIPIGWTVGTCKCGFVIATLPDGKHYCPKCS